MKINRAASRAMLLASSSLLAATLSASVNAAVIDYPNGSTNSGAIVLTDNSTQLQVLTGSATQSGVISESGGSFGLEKIGSGTLIFTGVNTYTGVTTISAGTLQLGAGGSLGFGGNIIDNSNFAIYGGSTASGTISGSGMVTVLSNGTATLTGNNTYTGGTTILTNASLTVGSGAAGSIAGNFLDDGYLEFRRDGNITFGGVVSGSGRVAYLGNGRLILTGENTYSGQTEVVSGGIQIGNGGTTGSIAGDITGGNFYFDRSDDIVFSENAISAGVIQLGNGKLTLTGTNTISFSFGASNGTLIIGASSTVSGGSMVLSGTGVVKTQSSFTAENLTVSGNNAFAVASGKSATFTGNVTIQPSSSLLLGSATETGTIVFSGRALGAAGSIEVAGGTLRDASMLNFDGTGTLALIAAFAPQFTIDDGATVDFNDHSVLSSAASTVGMNLQGSGIILLGSKASTELRLKQANFSGAISGAGKLTLLSGGTSILSGANTFTGGVTINSGATLQLGDGNASGSVVGSITDNGALAFNRSDSVIYGAIISGSGSVTQAGSGELILSGANTYTGATSVTTGALNVTGSIAASSGVTIANGAMLSGTGTVSSTTIQSGGMLSAGSGGVGTLNVSGNLTLDSGAITQVDVTPASADKIAVSGTASINGMLNVAFAGGSYMPTQYALITSTGALSGTFSSLNLTGAPSGIATSLAYDANTVFLKLAGGFTADSNFNIDSGTANVSGDQATGGLSGTGGTINIGTGSLTDNQVANSTYAGAFAGSGSFIKTGGGTLILNGNSAGFTGTTIVTGGLLEVGDAAHPGAILGGTVNVASGGTLGGHGTIAGSVTTAGSTAPGGSIGTLIVTGNYAFTSGASLQQEVAANGSADLLKVGGAVTIAGNTTLQVQATDPVASYARVTSYTIVTGAAGVSGAFSHVVSPTGLTSIVGYAPGAVNLTLVRNDISLATLATTANQAGAGAAISAAPGSALFVAVAPLGDAQIPAALDSLSGEIHASVRSAAVEDGRVLRQSILEELAAGHDGLAVWGTLFASSGHIDSDGNAAAVNHTNGGGIAGVDVLLAPGLRAGIAGAYAGHAVGVPDRASHASGASGHVLAYAGWDDAALHLKLGADFGWGRDDIRRDAATVSEADTSHQDLATTQLFGDIGYSFAAGSSSLEPYAQIAWLQARSGGFAESGGPLSVLTGDPAADTVTYGSIGLRARFHAFDMDNGMSLAPRLDLGLQHAFQAFLPSQTLALGAGSFLVSGAPLPDDAATVGAGIDLALMPSAHLSLGYDGVLGSHATNHAVRAQLHWSLQ